MAFDVRFGRWLAMCAHPALAVRVLRPVQRGLLVTSYFLAAYVAVLTALLVLRP
jgi:hypothetical protein